MTVDMFLWRLNSNLHVTVSQAALVMTHADLNRAPSFHTRMYGGCLAWRLTIVFRFRYTAALRCASHQLS